MGVTEDNTESRTYKYGNNVKSGKECRVCRERTPGCQGDCRWYNELDTRRKVIRDKRANEYLTTKWHIL